MLEHIVKNGEKIDDIKQIYKVNIDEIKLANLHITDFKNIVPGTKIKIPLLNFEVEQILDKTESFVMNYYPKISKEIIEVKEDNKEFEVPKNKEIPKGRAYPGILPPKHKNNRH